MYQIKCERNGKGSDEPTDNDLLNQLRLALQSFIAPEFQLTSSLFHSHSCHSVVFRHLKKLKIKNHEIMEPLLDGSQVDNGLISDVVFCCLAVM